MSNTSSKIILGIIVLLVIVGGIYFFSQNKTPAPQTVSQTATTTTSTLPINTYGMSPYADPIYGFSFWYPSALQVTSAATEDTTDFPGGTAVETLQIGSTGGTSVVVVDSPTSSITDEPADHASPIAQTEYSYDTASNQWMVSYPQGTTDGSSASPAPANISKTTMSGLIMLPSGKRFDTTIIPLSTTRFLVISDGGGSTFTTALAQTVLLAGVSVDPSTQAAALQSEQAAYANMQ